MILVLHWKIYPQIAETLEIIQDYPTRWCTNESVMHFSSELRPYLYYYLQVAVIKTLLTKPGPSCFVKPQLGSLSVFPRKQYIFYYLISNMYFQY